MVNIWTNINWDSVKMHFNLYANFDLPNSLNIHLNCMHMSPNIYLNSIKNALSICLVLKFVNVAAAEEIL